ncbi:MAG: hypothetical protein COV55_05065 [Candidatus Komeilibacteria bacterium CG11_big_fil_rev_8_21_14_0_20_36_20]|uniref:Uncharacterized protein n=1 Tax=Candidatus Komeilibacteria bacterium CG11_big_fil_rev_8_21_14_0_20_36_20 TaxID=1974477 RepID=A0A2H0NAZ8_9BACT|nr:MAG: hypothetical protein COV55_05065 [Candidatus Komeilibacteria bacterium CG11_big_fil_rev_8_21_14_0_20_36_20]PJC55050.1 MAG: hypothetical protein CO027_04285 [Candidatus Komeilibacteria bacterium CG_4_9_14_0_2_um_filter_36_13]
MSNQKIILIIVLAIAIAAGYYFYLSQKPEEKVTLNNYKTFVSQNKKLTFSYRDDWKCQEVVYDMRVDCYPLTRIEEEYDAGLDQPIVYYPDISLYDENELCSLIVDQESLLQAAKEPLIYNEYSGNSYGFFYKKFNNCLTKIVTLPYIDTLEKLEDIIK